MQIELDPTKADAFYNRGSSKSELGDNIGAIADYTKAIELSPTFSMAYNNRGWAKFKMKNYNEALKDLNKAIELDENNWVAYDSRQETKFAMNDYQGCIEDCFKAISLNQKSSNSYFFRGRAFYRKGDKTRACEDWSKAGELGKTEAYEYIAKYCNNSTSNSNIEKSNSCNKFLYKTNLTNTTEEFMFLFSSKTYTDKSKVVATLPENANLYVLEKSTGDDNYYLVCYNGTLGYISKYLLQQK
jgi:tetratricopeptide (TPR) repeat protein